MAHASGKDGAATLGVMPDALEVPDSWLPARKSLLMSIIEANCDFPLGDLSSISFYVLRL